MEQDPRKPDDAHAGVDDARRRLLKAGVYVAPAVLGTLLTRKASAQTSCVPSTCSPCLPRV